MIRSTPLATSIAPAKLILSGEHAVVYGNPALAVTIDRFTSVEIYTYSQNKILLALQSNSICEIDVKEMDLIADRCLKRHNLYLQNKLLINEVISVASELIIFSIYQALRYAAQTLTQGLRININSSVPVGCGMGSSAAVICGVMYAVLNTLQVTAEPDKVYPFALEAENLLHGYSSGLDIKTILAGGGLLFDKKHGKKRLLPTFPFYLVNTGKSLASTGECVSAVRSYFNDQNLLKEFAQTTLSIDQACMSSNYKGLHEAIRHNHKLLTSIGVVPLKVQNFIAEIEKLGGCAKICGGGSIKGETAGICLIFCDVDLDLLCTKYSYLLETVTIVNQGVTCSSNTLLSALP